MKRPHILPATVVALFPSVAVADGLIPAINAYSHTPVFYFTFAAVVLIESVCIRLWLGRMPFPSVLWRVVLLNAASSYAGCLLMRSSLRPEFSYVWQQAIPFFFLTLSVEFPLLLLLFRRMAASWRRQLLAGTAANVLSYIFLVAAERPVEAVWLRRLSAADHRVLNQWTNTQMLAQTTGLIYGTEGFPHRLRVFDPRENRWHSVTNCPPIDPRYWDVEGDVFAFKHYQEEGYTFNDITVKRLPGLATIAEISVANAINSQSGWEVKISPDRRHLAVLVPRHEMSAPLIGASYRCFGITCDLMVYEITSGRLVGVSPRKAFGGLCWLSDSRHVLFRSLRKPELHEVTRLENGWQKQYPDADTLFSDAPTYAYDIEAGSVNYFGAMQFPHLASEAGRLVYRAEPDGACILDPATGQTNKVLIGSLGYRDIAISPDGRFAIVCLRLTNPMAYLGYPAIVDLSDPSKRHHLDGFDYRLNWTTDEGKSRESEALKRPACDSPGQSESASVAPGHRPKGAQALKERNSYQSPNQPPG